MSRPTPKYFFKYSQCLFCLILKVMEVGTNEDELRDTNDSRFFVGVKSSFE